MSLSAREQRILSEIERDLTATEPLLGRALASMRLGLRDRMVTGGHAPRPRGRTGPERWLTVMLTGLAAGIAVLSAGLGLGLLAMVIAGTALAQLSLIAGWFGRALG